MPTDQSDLPTPPVGKPPSRVRVAWKGAVRFEGGRPGGPTIAIDGPGGGPGPVDTVLCALAACTTEDVLTILAKRRTPARSVVVDVEGERAAEIPARLTRIHLTFRIAGAGIDRANAERAIDLALNKYCSVRDSLRPDIALDWTLELTAE